MRMGTTSESVSFLDEIDLTLSLDSRKSLGHQIMSIEIAIKPIVFRASYRDINLITAIMNRAIEISTRSTGSTAVKLGEGPSSSKQSQVAKTNTRPATLSRVSLQGRPRVVMSKEHVSVV